MNSGFHGGALDHKDEREDRGKKLLGRMFDRKGSSIHRAGRKMRTRGLVIISKGEGSVGNLCLLGKAGR